ncbi:hypothetical protein D3C87_1212470 [compost metagenome]
MQVEPHGTISLLRPAPSRFLRHLARESQRFGAGGSASYCQRPERRVAVAALDGGREPPVGGSADERIQRSSARSLRPYAGKSYGYTM